jgi:hypothetical protein
MKPNSLLTGRSTRIVTFHMTESENLSQPKWVIVQFTKELQKEIKKIRRDQCSSHHDNTFFFLPLNDTSLTTFSCDYKPHQVLLKVYKKHVSLQARKNDSDCCTIETEKLEV